VFWAEMSGLSVEHDDIKKVGTRIGISAVYTPHFEDFLADF
jgi:hypothetical protein